MGTKSQWVSRVRLERERRRINFESVDERLQFAEAVRAKTLAVENYRVVNVLILQFHIGDFECSDPKRTPAIQVGRVQICQLRSLQRNDADPRAVGFTLGSSAGGHRVP